MQKHRRAAVALGLAALFLGATVAPAVAADAAKPSVIETWFLWVKDGHAAPFEAAMKTYVAWRKSAGEGRAWYAYAPVAGRDLAHYVFRAGPHFWKDVDATTEWERKAGLAVPWEKVAPHVARLEHYFHEVDAEHSLWTDSEEYRLFGVTTLRLRPGSSATMLDALTRVHKVAVDKKWPIGWSFQWIVGGPDDVLVVNPYRSYAEMAGPETTFSKILAEALGSEQAGKDLTRQLWSSFEAGSYTIYASRPDLSTPD